MVEPCYAHEVRPGARGDMAPKLATARLRSSLKEIPGVDRLPLGRNHLQNLYAMPLACRDSPTLHETWGVGAAWGATRGSELEVQLVAPLRRGTAWRFCPRVDAL